MNFLKVLATLTGRQLNRLGSKLGMDKDMIKGMNEKQLKTAIATEGQRYIKNMRQNTNKRVGTAFGVGAGGTAAAYTMSDFFNDLLGIKTAGKGSTFTPKEKEQMKKAQTKTKSKQTVKKKTPPKIADKDLPKPKPKKKKNGVTFEFETIPKGKTGKKKLSTGGALKKTTPAQKGLRKLPTNVRNKMGYMHNGGSPSKGKKGVMVISIGVGKMKKKK